MVTIKEALGINYSKILLKDNESLCGGKSESDETLGMFMDECDISPEDDYGELCVELEQCGLKAIRPIAHIELESRYELGYDEIDLLKDW